MTSETLPVDSVAEDPGGPARGRCPICGCHDDRARRHGFSRPWLCIAWLRERQELIRWTARASFQALRQRTREEIVAARTETTQVREEARQAIGVDRARMTDLEARVQALEDAATAP